jgi:hypothetical protein
VTGGDPWADPATRTQPGAPYGGPPVTAPVQPVPYGHPAPYGYATPYGHPAPWPGLPPRGPARPGQVVTAAVLAFVQAVLVLIASLYLWFFASVAGAAWARSGVYDASEVTALATEGTALAVIQLASAALLIAAGIRALSARTRAAWLLIVAATALQVVLTLYWVVRLSMLLDGAADAGARGAFVAFTVFFAAAPLVSLGLVLTGAGRRWFDGPRPS